jgi:LPS-assembly lipoprotein
MTLLNFLVLLCFSLLLAACGFHLQGTTLISPSLHTLYVESDDPYSTLTKNLRFSLESNKIKLVEEPNEAPFTLTISSEKQNMRTLGNAGDQQTRLYMLTDSVTISLSKSNHAMIVQPVLVSASRNFSLPAGTIASNSPMLATTTEQTQSALIQNILTKLSSKDFSDAIEGKDADSIHIESNKRTSNQCTGYVSKAS